MPKMPTIDVFEPCQVEVLNACPWCKSTATDYLFTENGFQYVQCGRCSLIYLLERVKEAYLHLVYSRSYHSETDQKWAWRTAEKRLALLGDIRPGARVHEDGAGSGAFVAVCRKNNLAVSGNDLGIGAVETAQRLFGLNLHHGSLESAELEPETVDILASFNLLSHLYRPWDYMKLVRNLLSPGGVWFVRTGDRTGRFRNVGRGAWSAPEHVYHYTSSVLDEMIHAAGLERTGVVPAFDSDYPYFLYNYSRNPGSNIFKKSAGRLCSYSILLWNVVGLPKDDIFFFARRKALTDA